MKIEWNSVNGTTTAAEADVEIGTFIVDSRREEANGDRKQRTHTYSLDAIAYEGTEYGKEDEYPSLSDAQERILIRKRVRIAFSRLTKTQQRRLWLHVIREKSLREIARLEGVTVESVSESVAAGKRKFVQIYQKGL